MAQGDTTLTITGNAVEDPELRFTPQGQPVARFRIASVPRYYDKTANEWRDGDGLFLTVNVWRQQAEHVAESIQRGARVVVTGRLRQRNYETKEGDKRTVYEIEADDVAASMKFATVKITKATRSGMAEAQTAGGGRPVRRRPARTRTRTRGHPTHPAGTQTSRPFSTGNPANMHENPGYAN